MILVIKRLGHGVGRVDEYGSNGTEYRASETLIKATDQRCAVLTRAVPGGRLSGCGLPTVDEKGG